MSDTKVVVVDVYGSKDAPDAARFGRGVTNLAEIKKATDARVNLSKQQSNPRGGPVARDS